MLNRRCGARRGFFAHAHMALVRYVAADDRYLVYPRDPADLRKSPGAGHARAPRGLILD